MKRFRNCAVPIFDVVCLTMLAVADLSCTMAGPKPNPVQFSGVATVNGGLKTVFTVPATKRLVIDHVSADAPVTAGVTKAFLLMRTEISGTGGPRAHYLVLTEQETAGPVTHLVTSQPMRVYADPGTAIEIEYHCSSASCIGLGFGVNVTVSGTLVTP